MLQSPNGYKFRKASYADINQIVALQKKLHAELKFPMNFVYSVAKSNARKVLKSGVSVVATYNNKVVGTLGYIIYNATYSNDLIAYEMGLYVDADHRKGLAYPMVKFTLPMLKERGVKHLYGNTNEYFPELSIIYKRIGMKKIEEVYRGEL